MRKILIGFFLLGTFSLPGQSTSSGADLLTDVVQAYTNAKRCLFVGKGTIESPTLRGRKSTEFTIAVELPDKMRLEGDASNFGMRGVFPGPATFVADGAVSWFYHHAGKKYYRIPRSSPQGAVGIFENRYPEPDRPEQTVAYFNFFITAGYQSLADKKRVTEIKGMETLSRNSQKIECFVVQSDRGLYAEKKIGSQRDTLWVDSHKPVIWRQDTSTWLNNGLAHSRTDYATVIIDDPLPNDTFVFTPPNGSKETPVPAKGR